MGLPRRDVLKVSGTSLASGVTLGSLASTGAEARADPADEFDAAHYTNYRSAYRGVSGINWVVLHTTAGRYSGAVSWFKNPSANVSAHYVISNDGYAKKMVRLDDIAYHASGFNANSIGIEHEWYDGMGPVTDATYRKSAEIVDYLSERFGITKRLVGPEGPCRYDSGFVVHRDAPTDIYCSRSNATTCPQGFDTDTYMSIVRSDSGGGGGGGGGGGDGGGGGGDTAPDPAFEEGDRVATTTDLNVRSGPGTTYSVKTALPEGSAGYVRGGPRENGGYRWWKIGYNAGYEGWSVQKYLTAAPLDDGDDDGDDGGDDGSGETGRRTETGSLSTEETAFYTHDPRSSTDEMTIRLSGGADLDVDLYVTVDGRRPDRKDYDRRSWNYGPDESIDLAGNELENQLGVLVDAYSGPGEYTLEFVPEGSDDPGDDDDDDFWDIIDDIFDDLF